jgi:uncharacterized FlaG/YvyC family protein
MSDQFINPIGWQGKEQASSLSRQERESKPVEKRSEPTETSTPPAETVGVNSSLHMTRVQFQVNEDTQDVVIYIRDKESDKVLRTIPAEAIKDLPPGQLMDILS